MAMTYPIGALYVNGTKVAEATNIEIVSLREAPHLPKPPRVEKWQRWRNQRVEYVVESVANGTAKLGGSSRASTVGMLACESFEFLGYAKPDKVEVGQRWGMRHKEYVVAMVLQNGEQALLDRTNPNAESGTSGRVSRASCGLLEASEWEYLGMAESAPIDGSAVEVTVVSAARITRAIGKALPESDGAEFDRVHAAIHANDKRVPITSRRVTLKAVDPGPGAANTRDVYVDDYVHRLRENGYEIVKRAVAKQLEKAIKTNAANVARCANEEAAKRLIANPPEWAYPKAWMCAVLAAQEWNNSHTVVPGMELSAIGWWIAVVCELEHRGRERSATIDGIATVVRDAYARGMDRPSPLLTRQGVKRGISTCDLGVDYE